MAVIVPAVVSFFAAGGAAGIAAAGAAVAAGTAGLAAYATLATVAGGFLSTIGGLTKNQKLAKFGGYLSLAGGIGQVANSLMGGASSSLVSEAAKESAEGLSGTALGEAAGEGAAEALSKGIPVGEIGGEVAKNAASAGGSALGPPGEMLASGGGEVAGQALTMDAIQQQPSIMEQARLARQPALDMGFGNTGLTAPGATVPVSSPLAGYASEIKDAGHLQSLLDRAGQAAGNVGQFVKDNKELVTIGGDLLKGGMGAYARQAEWDDQMSLMDARRRRLNQPIRLGQMAAPTVQPLPIGG